MPPPSRDLYVRRALVLPTQLSLRTLPGDCRSSACRTSLAGSAVLDPSPLRPVAVVPTSGCSSAVFGSADRGVASWLPTCLSQAR